MKKRKEQKAPPSRDAARPQCTNIHWILLGRGGGSASRGGNEKEGTGRLNGGACYTAMASGAPVPSPQLSATPPPRRVRTAPLHTTRETGRSDETASSVARAPRGDHMIPCMYRPTALNYDSGRQKEKGRRSLQVETTTARPPVTLPAGAAHAHAHGLHAGPAAPPARSRHRRSLIAVAAGRRRPPAPASAAPRVDVRRAARAQSHATAYSCNAEHMKTFATGSGDVGSSQPTHHVVNVLSSPDRSST